MRVTEGASLSREILSATIVIMAIALVLALELIR